MYYVNYFGHFLRTKIYFNNFLYIIINHSLLIYIYYVMCNKKYYFNIISNVIV